jgi:hypothetical protein
MRRDAVVQNRAPLCDELEVVALDGSGHYPMQELPPLTIALTERFSLTPCSEPMQAFFQCLRKQPVANWQCAPEGVAAIRDGFCDKEQAETVHCMQAKMRR